MEEDNRNILFTQILALARLMKVTPKQFIDAQNDIKANSKYLTELLSLSVDVMKDELDKMGMPDYEELSKNPPKHND